MIVMAALSIRPGRPDRPGQSVKAGKPGAVRGGKSPG